MDNDLISRSALLEKAWDADTRCGYVQVVDVGEIEAAPAVDVVRVVYGYWKDTNYMIPTVACSVCRGLVHAEYTHEYGSRGKYNFSSAPRAANAVALCTGLWAQCPFCGAKMNLKEC